jgi:hypothetical protein
VCGVGINSSLLGSASLIIPGFCGVESALDRYFAELTSLESGENL